MTRELQENKGEKSFFVAILYIHNSEYKIPNQSKISKSRGYAILKVLK